MRGALSSYARHNPAAIVLSLVIVLTSTITGTLMGAVTVGGDSLVWAAGTLTIALGWWWTPLTALFIAEDPVQVGVTIVVILSVFAVTERLLGTLKAAGAFIATGVTGIAIGLAVQTLLTGMGEFWATDTAFSVTLDPTIGVIGSLMVATAVMPILWSRRLRLLGLGLMIMFVLYNGDQTNFYRLLAALVGILLGTFLFRRRKAARFRVSFAESRNLFALIVGVTAIGPLASLVPPGGSGPLSLIGSVFSEAVPSDPGAVLARCGSASTALCDRELALVAAAGVGPVLLSLVPLILLLIAAVGLRRGRRVAWFLAIITNTIIAILSAVALGVGDIAANPAEASSLGDFYEIAIWALVAVAVPVGVTIMLLLNRRLFAVLAPRAALRRFWLITGITTVTGAVVYFVAALFNATGFAPDADARLVALDTVRRFIPPGLDAALGQIIVPEGPALLVFYQWLGPVAWAIAIASLLWLFGTYRGERTGAEDERFRALLHRHSTTLGFMGTWPGNVYWFSADGNAAVAYRVINGVAITMSDPVGKPSDIPAVLDEFIEFCDAQGWSTVFYSIHERYLAPLTERGWLSMSVGEETIMHPITLDMAGKPWQKIRQALNRGTKEGLTTLWTTWEELPPALSRQISEISEQWVAEKELPEMGFTLGAMEELKDPEVKLFIALDPDGRMQAITSWLPSYDDGRVVGWTIDFMRRGDGSLPGIMEYVIASAALKMQTDGVERLSLSAAPLATKPGVDDDDDSAMTRILAFLAETLEPAYGFSSLFKFKSKFNPEYETIYMAYVDPIALPKIGAAIGKAYLPNATPKEYLALARTLRS